MIHVFHPAGTNADAFRPQLRYRGAGGAIVWYKRINAADNAVMRSERSMGDLRKELNPGLCAPGHTQDGWVRCELNHRAHASCCGMIQKEEGCIASGQLVVGNPLGVYVNSGPLASFSPVTDI